MLVPRPANQTPASPSLALAVAVTGAMLAVALVAGRVVPRAWWERGARPVAERITFVVPPLTPAPPAPRTVEPAAPAATRPTVAPTTSGGTRVTAPTTTAPQLSPLPSPGIPIDTGAIGRRTPGAGPASVTGAAPAAARGPTLSPMPLRVGAELPASPPLTRGQKDSVLRAFTRSVFSDPAALAEAAASAADAKARQDDEARRAAAHAAGGAPTNHGVQITLVKIPFGGPSAEQRKRDSVIDADVRARLARAAERRARERADSLRRDSLRVRP
jgi:hypothetical protein